MPLLLCTSICKPMNSLDVSRIAGFRTDLCKKFLGDDPQTLLTIQFHQVKYNQYNALLYMYILPYTLLFTFWGKNVCPPPPHFSSLSYAIDNPSVTLWTQLHIPNFKSISQRTCVQQTKIKSRKLSRLTD